MNELTPIKYKKAYEDIITNQIVVWMWANIFKECFDILKNDTIMNDSSIIRDAIIRGILRYENGAFYSNTHVGIKIAQELESIGAKYSKSKKCWTISKDKLPNNITWAIETVKAKTYAKVQAIKGFLDYQLAHINEVIGKLTFDTAVKAIMSDLQKRVYANAKKHKIELITPKIDDFRANEIVKNYTNNLDFWIKDWTEQEIVQMREVVGQMSIEGKSVKSLEEYLIKQFGVSQTKARFLARNETAIATTSYLVSKYQSEGFTKFKWHTTLDGRERELHKELNNQIFRFDNPPIIDQRTGERGLPGETYNCLTGDMRILSPFPNFRIFKRKFAGELTELVLPMGRLKITANHPILTNRGWVSAKDIQIGDKIAKISNESIFAASTNPNDSVPTINEFFSFYSMLFNSQRVDITNADFHGDISIDKQVNVVNIESKLWNYFKPEFNQFDFEFILTETDKIFKGATSDNSFFKSFPIGRFISDNIISILSKAFSFFFSSESHSIEHSLGAISWLDTVLDKTIGYNITSDSEFFCKLFDTPALTEQTYKLIVWDVFYTMVYKFLSQQFSTIDKSITFNAEQFAQLGNGFSASIEFDTVQDKIISVFDGHIFNLQNLNNWYYTNNYITKNCRCTFSPIPDREWLENRKKMFKANNSFMDRLKNFFKVA